MNIGEMNSEHQGGGMYKVVKRKPMRKPMRLSMSRPSMYRKKLLASFGGFFAGLDGFANNKDEKDEAKGAMTAPPSKLTQPGTSPSQQTIDNKVMGGRGSLRRSSRSRSPLRRHRGGEEQDGGKKKSVRRRHRGGEEQDEQEGGKKRRPLRRSASPGRRLHGGEELVGGKKRRPLRRSASPGRRRGGEEQDGGKKKRHRRVGGLAGGAKRRPRRRSASPNRRH